jgi:hypothetical protein
MTHKVVSVLSKTVASSLERPGMAGHGPEQGALLDAAIENRGSNEKRGKWRLIDTLLFIALTCGAFWIAAFFGLLRLL